jgi:hypothetical protein
LSDINDLGQIVGIYYTDGYGYGGKIFLYNPSNNNFSEISFLPTISFINNEPVMRLNNNGHLLIYNAIYNLNDGSYKTIEYPGASETSAICLNNLGIVVGYFKKPSGESGHFLYNSSEETFTNIILPQLPEGGHHPAVTGINDNGMLIGYYQQFVGNWIAEPTMGFMYDPSADNFKILRTPPNLPWRENNVPNDINNQNQVLITGSLGYSYLYDDTNGTYAWTYPWSQSWSTTGINNYGTCVGYYYYNSPAHGFVLKDQSIINAPVIDKFTADKLSGDAPLDIAFVCLAHDTDGVITSYKIDFGDGSFDENSDGSFSRRFEKPGSYQVTCTATDNDGNKTVSDLIVIKILPNVYLKSETNPFGIAPLTVSFNASTNDISNEVTMTINYGDGTQSESGLTSNGTVKFAHVYQTHGVYYASCSIVGIDGASSSSVPITVTEQLKNNTDNIKAYSYHDDSNRFAFKFKEVDKGDDYLIISLELLSGSGAWYTVNPNYEYVQSGAPINYTNVFNLKPCARNNFGELKIYRGQYLHLDINSETTTAKCLFALDVYMRFLFEKKLEDVLTNDKEQLSYFIDLIKDCGIMDNLDSAILHFVNGEVESGIKDIISGLKEMADIIGHEKMEKIMFKLLGETGTIIWDFGLDLIFISWEAPQKIVLLKDLVQQYAHTPKSGYVRLEVR